MYTILYEYIIKISFLQPVDIVIGSAGAKIIGTGRSDFPNQVNNVLAFPGIFKGALEVRATDINEEMKLVAAYAIAEEEVNA